MDEGKGTATTKTNKQTRSLRVHIPRQPSHSLFVQPMKSSGKEVVDFLSRLYIDDHVSQAPSISITGLPELHGTRDMPSGLLPSVLNSPGGSNLDSTPGHFAPHTCQYVWCGAFSIYGLSCKSSEGCHIQHAAINDIIHRTLRQCHGRLR